MLYFLKFDKDIDTSVVREARCWKKKAWCCTMLILPGANTKLGG